MGFSEPKNPINVIGLVLPRLGFGSDNDWEAKKMESQLRAAKSKDRGRMKNGDRKRRMLEAAVKGDSTVAFQSNYQQEMRKWIDVMRDRFSGVAIRRNLQSVDDKGDRISGLGPIHEHPLLVKLYSQELENLEALAKEVTEDGTHQAAKAACAEVKWFYSSSSKYVADDLLAGLLCTLSKGADASELRHSLPLAESRHS
jgi:hypothetical protein